MCQPFLAFNPHKGPNLNSLLCPNPLDNLVFVLKYFKVTDSLILKLKSMFQYVSGAPEHMWTWGHVHTIFWDKALKMSHFCLENILFWTTYIISLFEVCPHQVYTFRRHCLVSKIWNQNASNWLQNEDISATDEVKKNLQWAFDILRFFFKSSKNDDRHKWKNLETILRSDEIDSNSVSD